MFNAIRRKAEDFVANIVRREITPRVFALEERASRHARRFDTAEVALLEQDGRIRAVNDRVSKHATGSIFLVDKAQQHDVRLKEVEALQAIHASVFEAACKAEDLQTELNAKNIAIQDLQDELAEVRAQQCESPVFTPTWIDSKGKVHPIDLMPTPYIVNCLGLLRSRGLTERGPGSGIVNAFTRELVRRRDDERECRNAGLDAIGQPLRRVRR